MPKTVAVAEKNVVKTIIKVVGKVIYYVLEKGFEIIKSLFEDKDASEKGVQWKFFGIDFLEINIHRRAAMVT